MAQHGSLRNLQGHPTVRVRTRAEEEARAIALKGGADHVRFQRQSQPQFRGSDKDAPPPKRKPLISLFHRS